MLSTISSSSFLPLRASSIVSSLGRTLAHLLPHRASTHRRLHVLITVAPLTTVHHATCTIDDRSAYLHVLTHHASPVTGTAGFFQVVGSVQAPFDTCLRALQRNACARYNEWPWETPGMRRLVSCEPVCATSWLCAVPPSTPHFGVLQSLVHIINRTSHRQFQAGCPARDENPQCARTDQISVKYFMPSPCLCRRAVVRGRSLNCRYMYEHRFWFHDASERYGWASRADMT